MFTVGGSPASHPQRQNHPLWYNRRHMGRKVIIVGAGFTGVQLARTLIAEGMDVSLVDRNAEKVQHARNALDCTIVQSDGNNHDTLAEAGISSADALVALTEDDEVNMIVCSLVDADYPDVLKIARVRNYAYYQRSTATARRHADATAAGARRPLFGVDLMLNPDVEAAAAISRAMTHGAVGNVIELGGGYGIVSLPVIAGGPLDGKPVRELASLPEWKYLIAYAETGEGTVLPSGNTVLAAGDRMGVLSQLDDVPELIALTGGADEESFSKIAIFGADRVGMIVAGHRLPSTSPGLMSRIFNQAARQRTGEVMIIDRDPERCREASENFPSARVLCGDMTDADLVREESLDEADLMVAASGNYESNLVMAAYLKSRGVRRTIALTSSGDFDDVARKLGVDVAVPMRDTVVDCIVSHLRGKGVKSIHTVSNRLFEIVECEVAVGSRAAGKTLQELADAGEFLVLLVSAPDGEGFAMPNGSTVMKEHAHVVLVVRSGSSRIIRMFAGKA